MRVGELSLLHPEKRWSDVPNFRDITTFTKEAFLRKQDLKPLPSSPMTFRDSPSPSLESDRNLRMNATCGQRCARVIAELWLRQYGP